MFTQKNKTMKKNLLASIFYISFITVVSAQTAVDFTANDCNAVSHSLFTELNAGKVVVMAFVMPCSSCIGPSLTAYSISQSYSTTNPGQVLFYLLDDVANTTCSSLAGWATNNNIGPNLFAFSNTNYSETDYGASGMPKIVVVGGANHTVYFNQNNSAAGNSTAIQAAIDLALSEIAGVDEAVSNTFSLDVFPNPSSGKINLSYVVANHEAVTVQLLNSIGQVLNEVNNQNVLTGLNELSFDTNRLSTGIYFIRIASASGNSIKKFIVE